MASESVIKPIQQSMCCNNKNRSQKAVKHSALHKKRRSEQLTTEPIGCVYRIDRTAFIMYYFEHTFWKERKISALSFTSSVAPVVCIRFGPNWTRHQSVTYSCHWDLVVLFLSGSWDQVLKAQTSPFSCVRSSCLVRKSNPKACHSFMLCRLPAWFFWAHMWWNGNTRVFIFKMFSLTNYRLHKFALAVCHDEGLAMPSSVSFVINLLDIKF